MKYNQYKDTDLNVSAIALGTWVFGADVWGGADENDCIEAVHTAIDNGINFIDTAPIYGNGLSEQIVGKAIAGKRDKVCIATKCGLIGQGMNIKNDLSPASIRTEVEASLSRLRIDYIDLYQCHWPDSKTPIEDTMNTLNELVDEGKIRYIGVSNFDVDLMARSKAAANVISLQSQLSILDRVLEDKILPFCVEHGVGLMAYGVLGGGILTGKYKQDTKFKGADARNFFYKFYQGEAFKQVNAILEVMRSVDQPLSQVAINWVRQKAGVTTVLAGCRNRKQVEDNVAAAHWDLTEEQIKQIDEVKFNGQC